MLLAWHVMRERSGFYPLNNWDPSLFPSSRSNTGFLTPDETFVTFLFFFGRLSQYWTCNLGRIFSRLDSTISKEKYFENIFGIIKKLNYIWTNNEIFISLRKISLLFSRAAPVFTSSLIIPISCKIKKKRKSVQYRITLYSHLLLFLFLLLLLLFFSI